MAHCMEHETPPTNHHATPDTPQRDYPESCTPVFRLTLCIVSFPLMTTRTQTNIEGHVKGVYSLWDVVSWPCGYMGDSSSNMMMLQVRHTFFGWHGGPQTRGKGGWSQQHEPPSVFTSVFATFGGFANIRLQQLSCCGTRFKQCHIWSF